MDACKSASFEAKVQLDEKIECPLKRTEAVVDLYSDIYGKDHNVKANFKDALFLYALGDMPLSFENRKGKEVHLTAEEAVDLSKHDMKKAVKEAREDLGLGRKTGGGRKKTVTPGTNAKPEDTKPGEVINIEPEVLDPMDKEYWQTFAKGFHDDEWISELKDALKAQGYRLTKIPTKE